MRPFDKAERLIEGVVEGARHAAEYIASDDFPQACYAPQRRGDGLRRPRACSKGSDIGADVVGDGRQALERLDHAAYDVILMDVQMPEMDRLEASRAICARCAASERPRIIAMTAEAMQGDRDKCLAAGMDDYIVKPVTLDRLAAALAKCRPLAASIRPEAETAPPVGKQKIAAGTALDHDVLDQLHEDLGGTATPREVIRSFLDRPIRSLGAA